MPCWTIDGPGTVDLGDFAALRVRLVSGSLAILATDDAPALDVASLSGQPLQVTHEAGILTISYEDLRLDGLLGWLRPQRHEADITLTVPAGCPMRIGVVNASATVAGVAANISAKSVSGDLMLDGVTGAVDAKTVSGNMAARSLDGDVAFSSVTGGLTLASSSVRHLAAKTVTGQVTADIDLPDGGGLRISTVSGAVAVRLPVCSGVQVDLKSTSGRVHCTFDGMRSSDGPGPASVTGTVGSGAASLSAASMTGDVTLLARAEHASPGQPAEPASKRQGGAS
jgi:Putative adhesin